MSLALLKTSTIRSYPVSFHQFNSDAKYQRAFDAGPYYFATDSIGLILEAVLTIGGFVATDNPKQAALFVGARPYGGAIAPHQRIIRSEITPAGLHRLLSAFSFAKQRRLSFYPLSFLIPQQIAAFEAAAAGNTAWAEKPPAGPIRIISGVPDRFSAAEVLLQAVVPNPLLIRGFKFDIRFFVAVPSLSPLRVYLHSQGIASFAADPFCPHFDDFARLAAHVPSLSEPDDAPDGAGKRWSHAALWPVLESLGYDRGAIVRAAEAAIVQTIIAAASGEQRTTRAEIALFEFAFAMTANTELFLTDVSPVTFEAAIGVEGNVKGVVVRDFLALALLPRRSAFADRIEETFTKPELKDLGIFMNIVEFEIAELRKGGFRRVFPVAQEELLAKSEADEMLEKYIGFSAAEQTEYYAKLVPMFDQYIEDLLDCKNQGAGCAVA
jgi:hypothetical protein